MRLGHRRLAPWTLQGGGRPIRATSHPDPITGRRAQTAAQVARAWRAAHTCRSRSVRLAGGRAHRGTCPRARFSRRQRASPPVPSSIHGEAARRTPLNLHLRERIVSSVLNEAQFFILISVLVPYLAPQKTYLGFTRNTVPAAPDGNLIFRDAVDSAVPRGVGRGGLKVCPTTSRLTRGRLLGVSRSSCSPVKYDRPPKKLWSVLSETGYENWMNEGRCVCLKQISLSFRFFFLLF